MKLKITIDGKTYEVDVEAEEETRGPGTYAYYSPRPVQTPASAPVRSAPGGAAPAAPPAVADESKVCRSPIAGVVVRVNTHEGQQIQVDDPLVVLEAMKMETTVTSPVAGKVKTVNAVVGEGVLVGQVLVEFE